MVRAVAGLATARDADRLRRQIAADPDAVFNRADTGRSEGVSWEEWKTVCSASVHGMHEDALRIILDEMAEGDSISRDRLSMMVEKHRIVRRYVDDVGCKEALVEGLILIPSSLNPAIPCLRPIRVVTHCSASFHPW